MVSHEIVKNELRRIAKINNGLLRCEDVVETAKDTNSPLHTLFEWDNNVAGAEYRLWQARQIIRVTVDYHPVTNKPFEVFVSLSSDRNVGGGYRELVSVMYDENQRNILLIDALVEMNRFIRKYESIKELADIISGMKESISNLQTHKGEQKE